MQAPSLRQLIAFRGGLKLDSTAAAYRSYYGFGLFFNLILWVPVFYEIQRRCGLSDREIFTIQSVYHLVFCLFEIPTGFFADRFGYHRSLTLGAVSFIAANLIVVLRSDAVGFALHFFAVSLSRSLVSGAASAWLYDFMRERGESQRYKQVEGRARALGLAGKVICWSAVGWLVNLHLMLPYWLTAGCGVAAFAFARSLPAIGGEAAQRRPLWGSEGILLALRRLSRARPNIVSCADLRRLFARFLPPQKIFGYFRGQRTVWLVIGQGLTMFVVARVIQVNIYQPLLASKGFALTSYGAIMAAMTLTEAFGNAQVHRVMRFCRERKAVVMLNIVIAASLLVVAFTRGPLVIAGFLLFSLAAGLIFPLQKQMINDALASGSARATLLSFESIVDRLVSAAVLLPMGPLVAAGRFDLLLVVTAGGAVLLTGVLGYFHAVAASG